MILGGRSISNDVIPLSHRFRILILIFAGIAVYWNTIGAPFLFDDRFSIEENPTIRSFSTALSPPADGSAVTNRPVVNLSFALNYAAGGTSANAVLAPVSASGEVCFYSSQDVDLIADINGWFAS